MPLVSVPTSDSDIFWLYFECEWNKEIGSDWTYWNERQKLIERMMKNCGYQNSGMSCFWMLSNYHDIVYNREH